MHYCWQKVFSTSDIVKAEWIKYLLQQNDIDAIMINKRDSAWNLGDMEIYVPYEQVVEAIELIKNTTNENPLNA